MEGIWNFPIIESSLGIPQNMSFIIYMAKTMKKILKLSKFGVLSKLELHSTQVGMTLTSLMYVKSKFNSD